MAWSSKTIFSTRRCRFFARDLFACIIAMRINAHAARFGAFHALTVDDGRGGTGFSPLLLARCT